MTLHYIVAVVVGYLLGSIPAGYVMGRIYGVDVLQHGSGKTGGTNLARLVGWPKTLPVALLDPGKAAIAILIVRYITHNELAAVVAGLAALAGHNWSLYLGFRGGRGVGPTVGAMFVFSPLIAAVSGLLGIIIAVSTRYVSLGSILGSACAIVLSIIAFYAGASPWQHLLFAIIACSAIIALHKDNIERLLAGTERKLGQRAAPVEEPHK